ncbi:hypothetical protein O181_089733 [Austropuccinia psidii MF-1]|uniref:Uncharacterized protein n=1 Tax=Austropuccinia psidii MF-1 TaxID=1389203 RepID=A0A9Q3IU19_9BASI|nr:hypothetical protein [Austropuccinia psidii MF-1]
MGTHTHAYAPAPAREHTHTNATAPPDTHPHPDAPANETALADAHANANTPHLQYCEPGSTSVIRKMTILRRRSPCMDDLVRSKPPSTSRLAEGPLWCVHVERGGSCVIFTNSQMLEGGSGGEESQSKAQGNQYWWISQNLV